MGIEKRLVFAQGEGWGSGVDGEFGVNRCRLLHLESISNGVLLYRIGNYVQSLGVEHGGREYGKSVCVCVCVCVCARARARSSRVTLLHSRNWRNIVNQVYINKKFKNPLLCFLGLHVSSRNSFCHKTRTSALVTGWVFFWSIPDCSICHGQRYFLVPCNYTFGKVKSISDTFSLTTTFSVWVRWTFANKPCHKGAQSSDGSSVRRVYFWGSIGSIHMVTLGQEALCTIFILRASRRRCQYAFILRPFRSNAQLSSMSELLQDENPSLLMSVEIPSSVLTMQWTHLISELLALLLHFFINPEEWRCWMQLFIQLH